MIVMPRLDGTGPYGMGPLTGRKLGNCNYFTKPKFLGYGFRKNKQYKNRYFQYFILIISSLIIGIYYILKVATNNNTESR